MTNTSVELPSLWRSDGQSNKRSLRPQSDRSQLRPIWRSNIDDRNDEVVGEDNVATSNDNVSKDCVDKERDFSLNKINDIYDGIPRVSQKNYFPIFEPKYPSALKRKKHKYSKVFNFPLGTDNMIYRTERIIRDIGLCGYTESFMGVTHFYINQLRLNSDISVFCNIRRESRRYKIFYRDKRVGDITHEGSNFEYDFDMNVVYDIKDAEYESYNKLIGEDVINIEERSEDGDEWTVVHNK
jgi:hypothetical protein